MPYSPPSPSRSPPLSPASSASDSSRRSLTSGLKLSHGPKPRTLKRIESICCSVFTLFPLAFVYGTTTWAVWVASWSIGIQAIGGHQGKAVAVISFGLYFMLAWSYTIAVFTPPGSPIDNKTSYSHLPTSDPSTTTVTVKASGEERYCKKCQCRKPDRAHHCSSCKTCVLKMDHHCPWLATCLGLRNYKAFILFLSYLSIFCVYVCTVSIHWLYKVFYVHEQYLETFMPINWVLLAIISFIVGLVISGFTLWHVLLILRGETTIESLEKTRYTSPLKRRTIPPNSHLYHPSGNGALSPQHLADRERERYNSYIIEETSKQLPNAFDLGRKSNFAQVFGPHPWLWFLPICNSIGDGWSWETSIQWQEAQRELAERRRQDLIIEEERSQRAGWGNSSHGGNGPVPVQPSNYARGPQPKLKKAPSGNSKVARLLGAREEEFSHGLGGSRYAASKAVEFKMQDLKKKPTSRVELSEDELDLDDYDENDDGDDDNDVEFNGAGGSSNDHRSGASSANKGRDAKPSQPANDEDWSEGW